jgi:hypothetical protein
MKVVVKEEVSERGIVYFYKAYNKHKLFSFTHSHLDAAFFEMEKKDDVAQVATEVK